MFSPLHKIILAHNQIDASKITYLYLDTQSLRQTAQASHHVASVRQGMLFVKRFERTHLKYTLVSPLQRHQSSHQANTPMRGDLATPNRPRYRWILAWPKSSGINLA
jgi:hypothetical protein